jgi:hypothetical protein
VDLVAVVVLAQSLALVVRVVLVQLPAVAVVVVARQLMQREILALVVPVLRDW